MPGGKMKLIGVQIAYCDRDGREKLEWLNLQQVRALAWTEEEIKAKAKGKTGNSKLPSGAKGKCNPGTFVEESVCWWNGSEWVCGEDN